MIALHADNIAGLRRLRDVVAQMTAKQYTASVSPCDSGIGAHVRHVLDHYDALWIGLERGHINYDERQRDPRTEQDVDYALQRIDDQVDRLGKLQNVDPALALTVCMDCGSTQSTEVAAPTSLQRELQFLASHTVHHDALIAAAAAQLSLTTTADFGVAPSTLRHASGT